MKIENYICSVDVSTTKDYSYFSIWRNDRIILGTKSLLRFKITLWFSNLIYRNKFPIITEI